MMKADGPAAVIDAGLIAGAQRAEHYEIGAYGCIRAFAEATGHPDIVDLVDSTLQEERTADKALTGISMNTVIPAAIGGRGERADLIA